MLKTILVLPDGTELSSGVGTVNAIQSVTITQCVNDDQELTVGSACANMIEASIITPGGGLNITAGDELAVYREDQNGKRHKVGLFLTEKPTRPSANTMRITAFDRMILLDTDLTGWLAGLTDWPYTVDTFANMVCGSCGLTLKNETLANGAYKIQKFTAEGLTGRRLIKWIGQIAGCFARITTDGELEFAWYADNENASIGPSYIPGSRIEMAYEAGDLSLTDENLQVGYMQRALTVTSQQLEAHDADTLLTLELLPYNVQYYFYQNGLSFEDYQVAPIEKVQLRQTQEDVGCVYPADLPEAVNTYQVTGNGLLTTANAAALEPVASHLYTRLAPVSYTPCKVSIPANMAIHAGDILRILDRNGKRLTMYVMKKTQTGQRETLECTGSPRRDSSQVVNSQTLASLSGKVFTLRMDIEGLKAENKENEDKTAKLEMEVDGIQTQVQRQQAELNETSVRLTQVRQDAETVAIEIRDIRDNGVSRVETATGYTFGSDGLRIQKSGEEMENRLDNTGMYVTRSGETILQANSAGVVAADVTVHNYLRLGDHARLEDYAGRRTACFFV